MTLKKLPFVESSKLSIVLQTSFVDEEFHSLEKASGKNLSKKRNKTLNIILPSGDAWRLFAQKNINRFGSRYTELMRATCCLSTAFGIFTISESV